MAISKPKLFTLLIAILSLVGMILLLAEDFGVIWIGSYYYRYSCLGGCEYNTGVDTAGMIIGVVLLALQLLIAVNSLLPTPFLKKLSGVKFVAILGLVTVAMMAMGGISFGVKYDSALGWWFGAAFYGGLIAGILNTVLAVISSRIKN